MSTPNTGIPPRTDAGHRVAAWIGILIFLVGVGLIGYVFFTASALYHTPPAKPISLPTPTPVRGASPLPDNPIPRVTGSVIQDLGAFVRQLLTLLVMCLAGSAVAALGVRLLRK